MAFVRSQIQYDNGYYKWTAPADHDNPYYRGGTDHRLLNKTEGYEVLYFLNHIGPKIAGQNPSPGAYQRMETMLRDKVPPHSTHQEAKDYIRKHW